MRGWHGTSLGLDTVFICLHRLGSSLSRDQKQIPILDRYPYEMHLVNIDPTDGKVMKYTNNLW